MRHQACAPSTCSAGRMEMLTLAVLSQLWLRANWHRIAREWMYGDEAVTELGREEGGVLRAQRGGRGGVSPRDRGAPTGGPRRSATPLTGPASLKQARGPGPAGGESGGDPTRWPVSHQPSSTTRRRACAIRPSVVSWRGIEAACTSHIKQQRRDGLFHPGRGRRSARSGGGRRRA